MALKLPPALYSHVDTRQEAVLGGEGVLQQTGQWEWPGGGCGQPRQQTVIQSDLWEQRAGWKQDLLAGHWWRIGSVDSGWWAVSLLKVISSLKAGRMPHSFLGSSSLPCRVFAHGGTFKDIRIWILKQSCITESTVMLSIQGPRVSEWQSLG